MKKINTVPYWSFSLLDKYTACPYQVKLTKIDKIPEISRGKPPSGMSEWPSDRGNRVHNDAESYVRAEISDITQELTNFYSELYRLRELYPRGIVIMEDMWNFRQGKHIWEALPDDADYKDIWLRIKLDVAIFVSGTHGVMVDHKTGKKFGNEYKHAQQGQLYQLAMFLRFPKLEYVDVEFWYHDQNLIYHQGYKRRSGLMFYKSFNERAIKMTTDTYFDANPNAWNCRFCPHGPKNTSNKWVKKNGACKHGV